MSVFETLSRINVNGKVEKKNGLTYLSWAWAWGEVKKLYPAADYIVYENGDGLNYHHDNKTAWVKTGVKIQELEHIEYLPVMDYRNRSIPVDKVTSFDVNKAIQRSLTKAIARHGLGLYIYAGEDFPEDDKPVGKTVAKDIDEVKKDERVKTVSEVFPEAALELFFSKETVITDNLIGCYVLDIKGKKYKGELIKENKEHYWKSEKGTKSPVSKSPDDAKFYPIAKEQINEN